MGNVYEITKCSDCNKVFEPVTVMVHSGRNYGKIETMLKNGMSIRNAQKYFCKDCGEFMEVPCTCIEDMKNATD